MTDKSTSLFRKEAISHFASIDEFDQALVVTSRKAWLILIAVCLFITGIVVWGIYGSVPVRINGEGILLVEKGSLYNAVAPEGAGRIIRFAVSAGDHVKRGDVIAYLDTPDLTEQLNNGKQYLQVLQKEYQELNITSQKEIKKRKKFLDIQAMALQRALKSEQDKLVHVEELLKIKQDSFKRGIATKEELTTSQRDFYNSKRQIEEIKERITSNKIALTDFVDQWQQRMRDLELKVKHQQHEVANLQAKLKVGELVKSAIDGIVVDILATVGDKVEGGKAVASIATTGQGLDALIYVPAHDGKLIKPKMEAFVSPTTVKREEYGSIVSQVLAVSDFPSSPQAIRSVLQNDELVKKFSGEGAPIAVRVRLFSDPNTFSGFKWSSSNGPPQKITPGTLVTAMITVEYKRPITLVIPTIKKLLWQ